MSKKEESSGDAAEYEMHADGVKEVKREACRFCKPLPPCENDHCPTKDEQ